MSSNEEKTALVLQGGGALGAYQGGAYEALERGGQSPSWVAGMSIGAINGAIICGNPPGRRVEKLRELWKLLSSGLPAPPLSNDRFARALFNEASATLTAAFGVPGFFSPRFVAPTFNWPWTGVGVSLYDTTPLRETLLSLVDFDLINSGLTRLCVGAVNVRTGNFEYFDSKLMKIGPEHVMASAALPPGFPPIEINGELYWDGALVSNTPLQYVLDSGGPREDMCVFQIDLFSASGLIPVTLPEVTQREKDIRFSSRTRLNTDVFREQQTVRRAVKRLRDKAPQEFRDDPDWQALEKWSCGAAITIVQLIHRSAAYETQSKDYEFSRETMQENWGAGVEDVERTLANPAFRDRVRPEEGVAVLDLTKDKRKNAEHREQASTNPSRSA